MEANACGSRLLVRFGRWTSARREDPWGMVGWGGIRYGELQLQDGWTAGAIAISG